MENDGQRLARVSTNKEFLDELERMLLPKAHDDDLSDRGRLRELKTFMLESNDGFAPRADLEHMSYELSDTGLDWIKIMTVTEGDRNYQLYLDVSDKRFFKLHTNHKSEIASKIVRELTDDRNHTLDNTWLYHDMLKRLASKPGNHFRGFGISYSNKLALGDDHLEDLTLNIRGSMASEIEDLIRGNDRLNKAGAYDKVSIYRGDGADPYECVQDDVHNYGYFAIKHGKSIQDHLHIVEYCKEDYSKTIQGVENQRIGMNTVDGERFLDGNSFYFEFPNRISDLDVFIARVFNSAHPFQLWGLKQKIGDGYYKVLAVDLHTGSSMDFEIADDMMRTYIFKGSCGNTILRLLTNLQIYFDSQTRCPMVEAIACK